MIRSIFIIMLLGFIVLGLITQFGVPHQHNFMLLFENKWFWIVLSDLYIGLIVFFLFICFFETRLITRLLWLIALLTLGNIASLLYLIIYWPKVRAKLQNHVT